MADLKRSFYEQHYQYNQIPMNLWGEASSTTGEIDDVENEQIKNNLEYILSAFVPNLKELVQDPQNLDSKDPLSFNYFSVGKTFKGSLACFPSSTIHYGDHNLSNNVKASYFLTVAPKDMKDLPNTATQFHPLAIAQLYDGYMGNVFLATLWTFRRFEPYRHFYYVGKIDRIHYHCSTLLEERNFDLEDTGPWIGTILAFFLKDMADWLKQTKKPGSTVLTSEVLDAFYEHEVGSHYVDFRDNVNECSGLVVGDKMFSG